MLCAGGGNNEKRPKISAFKDILQNKRYALFFPGFPVRGFWSLTYAQGFVSNNQGFVFTPDLTVEKPAGTVRIVTLGGSAMSGLIGVAEGSPATHLRTCIRGPGSKRTEIG